MTITKDKMVSLTYELRLDGKKGEVFETAGKDNPLVFLYGAGLMIPAFENYLLEKRAGDKFEIDIPAKDGYGEINEEAVVDLPKSIFQVNGKIDEEMLVTGNTIPMMSAHGQRMDGLVISIQDETVTLDFNHPLAGEDLHFEGEVLDVRNATDEELNAVYSTGGGCGCGSGCGSDDCGDGGCGDSCSDSGCGSGCGCS